LFLKARLGWREIDSNQHEGRKEGQGEPAPPATSSEAGSNPYVVVLPDNGRDPEITEEQRKAQAEYFTSKQRR
jgi:hypothetical protein